MFEQGLEALWHSMGIANLGWGQSLMILVGGLLIFLAIRKGFEPLLLLPIGFGCILANVPVAGLAEDAVGNLLMAGDPGHLAALAEILGVPVMQLGDAVKHASGASLGAAQKLAQDLGYEPGMLQLFYEVAISTGVAPLLIFMGVGALTDFGALIARPSTLLLGAAAQFGIDSKFNWFGDRKVSAVELVRDKLLPHFLRHLHLEDGQLTNGPLEL